MRQLGNAWVEEALEILTDDQREVIGLRILGGFTIGQIADITGKRSGAVKGEPEKGPAADRRVARRQPVPSRSRRTFTRMMSQNSAL